MVNFGLNSASLLGIFLAVAGAGLYFLRSVRPELSRDHDIFFAAIGLLCGFILLFQGWRLDPILQFGQFLLTGSAIFFAVESIRMRGVATEQAKRNTPIVDDDRPVSNVYRTYQAELEELEPVDERPANRRLQGASDRRRSRPDDYDAEGRRRTSSRGSDERLGSGDRPRKRRPQGRPPERSQDDWDSPKRYDDEDVWTQQSEDDWGNASAEVVRKPRRPKSSGPSNPRERSSDTASRPRKNRPPQNSQPQSDRDVEATPTDYVDYQPIDRPDPESDNSGNFDY